MLQLTALLTGALLLLLSMSAGGNSSETCVRPAELRTRATELPEALFMTRCHLACIGKHFNETRALILAKENDALWPHLKTADISGYADCDTLTKVMECRRGCFIRSQNSSIQRDQCRTQCVTECQEECGTNTRCSSYSASSCPVSCTRSGCGGGCVLAGNLLSEEEEDVPIIPDHHPVVAWTDAGHRPLIPGLYNLSRSSNTKESGDRVGSSLTAFIAKIEVAGSSYYLPMTDPSGLLDLGQFSCETVDISFSSVTRNSVPQFSRALQLTVYGENQMPSQLGHGAIDYEWVEHSQPGLAVVTISWTRPQWSEFITSYNITIFSQTEKCGGHHRMIQFVNINKEATYFVWMPMTGYNLPVIECTYQAMVLAMPCPGESCIAGTQVIQLDSDSMKDNFEPTMELTCHKHVDQRTGVIAVFMQWEVQNVTQVIEAIGHYKIQSMLMDVRGDFPMLISALRHIDVSANGSRMAYVVHGLQSDSNENYQIFIRVTPKRKPNFSWRQVPDHKECPIKLQPLQPSVPGAEVKGFSVDEDSVQLNLTLQAPSAPYGDIVNYEVVLLREPPLEGDDPLNLNILKETLLEVNGDETLGTLLTENVNSEYRRIDQNIPCLYIQIRAKNEFLWSQWSDVIPIERFPEFYTNCSVFQEPVIETELYVYILASLGLVVVGVTIFLTISAVGHIYRRYHIRKQIERTFTECRNPIFTGCNNKGQGAGIWPPMNCPKSDDWELPSTSILLVDEQPLGEGCFGTVHRGVVKGPLPHSRMMKNAICMNVAVKFLKKTASGSEKTDFFTEIDTMKMVAAGHNPHIVNMIGCVTLQEPICLVTEFVKFGDLLTYLTTIRRFMIGQNPTETCETDCSSPFSPLPRTHNHPLDDGTANEEGLVCECCANGASDHNNLQQLGGGDCHTNKGACGVGDPNMEQPLSPVSQFASYDKLNPYANPGDLEPVNIVSFAYQIASGMEYLASIGLVHRDLASRNILIGEGKELKISDFGMSRTTVDDVYVKTTKGRLPWKWMAMESIMLREFTTATDVWSYGVTLWEIATLGGFPYPTVANGELLEYLRKGNRLECPEDCSNEIYEIMRKCWEETPEKRPSFSSLKTMFEGMLQENIPYIELDNAMDPEHLEKQPMMKETVEDEASLSTAPASSSSSIPLDASDSQLLISIPATAESTPPPVLDDQASTLVPPNLYVDTPTKPSQTNQVLDERNNEEAEEHPSRPAHLNLNIDIDETEV